MPLLTSPTPLSFRLREPQVHMHWLESLRLRQYLDANYRQGASRFLEDTGLLSLRLPQSMPWVES